MSPVRNIASSLQSIARRFQARELIAFGGALLIVLGVWFFIEIADEALEGESREIDSWVLRMVRDPDSPSELIGPHWMAVASRDLTALGGATVLLVIILIVAGSLAFMRKYHAMWLVLIASISGQIASHLLKRVFDRDRPDVVPHLTEVSTSAFPSGHAMAAAVVYLTLAAILIRLTKDRRVKAFILIVAMTLAFLVGLTRVFLGVHWPTDVLAGWSAGLVWALLCWIVALYLQKTGAVESENQITTENTESTEKGKEI